MAARANDARHAPQGIESLSSPGGVKHFSKTGIRKTLRSSSGETGGWSSMFSVVVIADVGFMRQIPDVIVAIAPVLTCRRVRVSKAIEIIVGIGHSELRIRAS